VNGSQSTKNFQKEGEEVDAALKVGSMTMGPLMKKKKNLNEWVPS
jgi:hypothetical protein